ncbi:MAG: DUF2339 domain-containing protein, partial [Sneathiella sp.]
IQPKQKAGVPLIDRLTDIRILIWIGGVALALGGLFVVKYSIEYGLLGPWGRIAAGAAVGGVMLALGDWFRRQPEQAAKLSDWAYLPLVVSGAGFVTLYGAVYAGYALYELFPAIVTIILMAGVAAAGLAYSLLLGPVLAALALIGAYLVPALVSTGSVSTELLYLYLGAVLAGSFVILRFRDWPWIGTANLALSALWFLLWGLAVHPGVAEAMVLTLYMIVFLGLYVYQFGGAMVRSCHITQLAAVSRLIETPGKLVYGAVLFAGIVGVTLAEGVGFHPVSLLLVAGLLPLTAWLARRDPFLEGGIWIAQTAALVMIFFWPASTIVVGEPTVSVLLIVTAILTGLFYVLHGIWRFKWQEEVFLGTLYAVAMPLLIFCLLFWKFNALGISLEWSLVALALAGGYVGAASYLRKAGPGQDAGQDRDPVIGMLALGGTGGLSLAFGAGLEAEWLTIAFALQVAAIGWIYSKIPVSLFRPMAALLAIIVIVRLQLDSEIVRFLVNSTVPVDWYIYGFGVPLLAFAAAWFWFSKDRRDYLTSVLESGMLLFWVSLIALIIRDVMAEDLEGHQPITFAENSLHLLSWLANALGLYWLATRRPSVVREVVWKILLGLSLFLLIPGQMLLFNPITTEAFLTGRWYGLTWLALGYLVPAALFLIWMKNLRPAHAFWRPYMAILSGALGFIYVNTEIRHIFRGQDLSVGSITDAEIYTYSVGWLLYALAIMCFGIWRGNRLARQAALLLLLATVVKVFVFDMSALEGLLRAVSFLGLGGCLIGVAFLYQRFGKEGAQENS